MKVQSNQLVGDLRLLLKEKVPKHVKGCDLGLWRVRLKINDVNFFFDLFVGFDPYYPSGYRTACKGHYK